MNYILSLTGFMRMVCLALAFSGSMVGIAQAAQTLASAKGVATAATSPNGGATVLR